ncbi:MAG TPA: carbohydrate-binding family 9-like protein [Opitutaceae bacterium]|nr:carbohydrate-binding family 9-like protein [Opitutaceae bacterium]
MTFNRPIISLLLACAGALPISLNAADELTTRSITFAAVPRVAAPTPEIDGDLSDPCWRDARVIEGFHLTAGNRQAAPQFKTTAKILFDETHVYVAFECLEPDVAHLKAGAKQHDDPDIEFDDRVEVFFDNTHDHRHYWELAVNPAGVQFDQAAFYRFQGSRTCDFFPEKNLFWRARTKVGDDRWTAEIAIDVTSLGLARIEAGTTWGFNLARVRRPDVKHGDEFLRHEPGNGAEYSAWVPVQDYINETISNFHAPLEFADVVFGEPGFSVEQLELPSAKYTMGPVGRATEFGWNPLNVKLRTADGKPHEYAVALSVEGSSPAGNWSSRDTTAFRSDENTALRYHISEDGENKITLQLLEPSTGVTLYRTSYFESVPPFADFDLSALYDPRATLTDSIKVRVPADDATRASSELRLSFRPAGDGAEIQSAVVSDLSAAEPKPVFDLKKLRSLPGGDYVIDCALVDKRSGKLLGKFRQKLTKPAPKAPAQFGAERVPYSFGGVALDAIRVHFPFDAQFVFWRGANYMPWWEMDQVAISYQGMEAWGGGGQGCNEAMQDRESRYTTVELVENSPARAVVHWRYALADAHYFIYNNEWVDEYFTLYPDGAGVRVANLWANVAAQHEVLDTIVVKPPGTRTDQLFEGPISTLANLDGKQISVRNTSSDRDSYKAFLASGKDFIAEFHFKNRLHPYAVFSFRDDLMPGVTRGMVSVSRTLFQNAEHRGHWPLARYPIDGYNVVGNDVPTHFSFGNIHTETDPTRAPNRWLFLIGAAQSGSDAPVRQAKAWLYPANVDSFDGSTAFRGYDAAERAYRLETTAAQREVNVRFKSADGVFHPVLLVKTKATPNSVRVDGAPLSVSQFAVGRTVSGEAVIYLGVELKDGATVGFALE